MKKSLTVRAVVSVYLENVAGRVKSGDLTKEVAENYARNLDDFVSQFGDLAVESCRQHDLTEFLTAHPGWKAVNTKRGRVSAVLACFHWARDEELILSCPYASPRALRGLIAETRRPATHEEFANLMEVGSVPLKLGLLFLYRSGCRTSEMRNLTWNDVRLDGPHPHLYLVKHKTFRRTGKARIVGLDRLCVRLLRAIRRLSKSAFVFVNTEGFPWRKDTWCHHLRRTAYRFGLDDGVINRVTAYCLRHTYACDGIEAGYTATQVAHQLGHSTSNMVERVYARHVAQRVGFISGIAVGLGDHRGKV